MSFDISNTFAAFITFDFDIRRKGVSKTDLLSFQKQEKMLSPSKMRKCGMR